MKPEGAEGDELDAETQERLNRAQASSSEDVTQLVKNIIGTSDNMQVIASIETESKVYREPDSDMVRELSWLKNIKLIKDLKIRRHLDSGKIDKRRLYRAPVDGLIFKETRIKRFEKKKVWLLADISGSMQNGTGQRALDLCAAAKVVLSDARIYTYRHIGNHVEINRVDDMRGMKKTRCDGGTPSGQALAYTSLIQHQDGGGLLIHFTDGGSNTGQAASASLKYASENFENLHIINVIYGTGEMYKERYPRMEDVHISSIDQFVDLMRSAVGKLWGIKV